ncbi:[FeFe] hydrogenase, group B1/B3 [Sporanaerobacter sp. PP17-6a]|nr:[FeFe] hydrogenase, group B1/B3 [Sporanaerobacter sp. PP17-6a]
MFPIVSPMIAHGKLIKRVYGMDTFVIFIGPCISKKVEAKEAQHDDVIDAVMTFEELKEWVYESQLDIDNMEYTPFDRSSTERGRNFPLKGGVLGSFLDDHIRSKYDVMNIDGIDECIDMLNTLMKDDTEGLCVELNACREGCINGPGVPKDSLGKYERKRIVKRYVNYENENFTTDEIDIPEDIDFGKVFVDKSFYRPKADEATIQSILRSIDKFTPEDELNCGACGYSTCREKVQAVYEGMAEKSMCMPYMKSRAERLSNHIFESSPNAIFVVDEDLKVVEFNKVCEKIFNIKSGEIMGKPISVILDDEIFRKVIETQDNIILQKVYYKEYGMLFLQNIILIEKENALLVIMTDITDEEKSKEELVKIKENALQAAQDVIEKQMRVAQEIAGLLGETTAETKVVLTKLKELVLKDGDVK